MAKCRAVDWTAAEKVFVSIKGEGVDLTLSDDAIEVEPYAVKVWLSQEQTIGMVEGDIVKVQVNWTYRVNGVLQRAATKFGKFTVDEQLLNEVVE